MERALRVRFARPIKVAALAFAAIALSTEGQRASPETQLGGPPSGQPDSGLRQPTGATTAEREAQEFYNVVRERLERGEQHPAQRLLEQLIARFPDTQIADQARRDLVALYAAASQRAKAAPLGEPSYLGAGRLTPPHPERSAASLAGPPAGQETLQGWRPVVRHARTLQGHFRLVAGDRVFFSEGSAELGASALAVLAAQAAWLKRYPQTAVVVEGHADDPGTSDENSVISAGRAEAVRSRLLEGGVEPERIVTAVYGRNRPVAICGEPQCSAQNRRAISVIKRARVDSNLPGGSSATGDGNASPMPGGRR
jgi:outer membrane protein OmpA-like peptidoglycan-associated protein